MKRQIHVYRGHDQIAVEGHNIKLGRGGIREIEFFVQTQQLIAGGRHPELRTRETLRTLQALAAGGWMDEQVARRPQRRLSLPAHDGEPAANGGRSSRSIPCRPIATGSNALLRFAGFPDRDAFADACSFICATCSAIMRRCSRMRPLSRPAAGHCFSARDRRSRDARPALRDGLSPAARSVRSGAALGHGRIMARCKSEFARSRLAEIVPVLLHHFARSANPDGAVIAFDRFLAGLHGGGRLLSLLRQNPDLIALMALVLGTAPRLADSLAQFPRSHGRGDRSELLRRAARGSRARGRPRSLAAAGGILRGLSRSHPHLRPGADVPDRNAHPVGNSVGGAGGRGLRPAGGRAHPLASPRDRGAISRGCTAASRGRRPRSSRSGSSAGAR